MKIHIANQQKDIKISSRNVKNIVKSFVMAEDLHFDEVSICFVTTKEICRLHALYFDDPSPTDCISFPFDESVEEGYRVMGEIFICPQTAVDYAEHHGKDPYEEVTLYLIHGLLHLIGYDDLEVNARRKMRRAEQKHLIGLKNSGVRLQA